MCSSARAWFSSERYRSLYGLPHTTLQFVGSTRFALILTNGKRKEAKRRRERETIVGIVRHIQRTPDIRGGRNEKKWRLTTIGTLRNYVCIRMDMIITRNSTRFRSLPVYTLTCGKYADCDSAHFFHRVALTTTAKEDEDNGRNMLTSVGDCKRAGLFTNMSHQPSTVAPNGENISRVQPIANHIEI